ncbi:MAG: hypothetical protein QME25_09485, partial [Bacteroidota bacterium]|nr:hypothetical protein [Bacteroidota bacterium]
MNVEVTGIPKTTYTFTDDLLEEGTTYYYRLKTCSFILVDLKKDGNPDEEACSKGYSGIVASTTKPAKPTALTAEAKSVSRIDIEWTNNSKS